MKSTTSVGYIVSFPQPASHRYHVKFQISSQPQDTLRLKKPNWIPGYYQLKHYAHDIENITAQDEKGKPGLLVLNNIKNKIVHQIFAVVRSQVPYDPEFVHHRAAA